MGSAIREVRPKSATRTSSFSSSKTLVDFRLPWGTTMAAAWEELTFTCRCSSARATPRATANLELHRNGILSLVPFPPIVQARRKKKSIMHLSDVK